MKNSNTTHSPAEYTLIWLNGTAASQDWSTSDGGTDDDFTLAAASTRYLVIGLIKDKSMDLKTTAGTETVTGTLNYDASALQWTLVPDKPSNWNLSIVGAMVIVVCLADGTPASPPTTGTGSGSTATSSGSGTDAGGTGASGATGTPPPATGTGSGSTATSSGSGTDAGGTAASGATGTPPPATGTGSGSTDAPPGSGTDAGGTSASGVTGTPTPPAGTNPPGGTGTGASSGGQNPDANQKK